MEKDKMNLPWKDEYSVGIEEIDKQHHHFIDLLNKAFSSFYDEAPTEKLSELLEQILVHADQHFDTEEKYFASFAYPEATVHISEHRRLKNEAVTLKGRLEIEGNKLYPDLIYFMEKWLIEHIEGFDRKYVSFFREHGVK